MILASLQTGLLYCPTGPVPTYRFSPRIIDRLETLAIFPKTQMRSGVIECGMHLAKYIAKRRP